MAGGVVRDELLSAAGVSSHDDASPRSVDDKGLVVVERLDLLPPDEVGVDLEGPGDVACGLVEVRREVHTLLHLNCHRGCRI